MNVNCNTLFRYELHAYHKGKDWNEYQENKWEDTIPSKAKTEKSLKIRKKWTIIDYQKPITYVSKHDQA